VRNRLFDVRDLVNLLIGSEADKAAKAASNIAVGLLWDFYIDYF
jgi:hypothetical protein